MFMQDENPLCICYSTQKSDIDTVVELGNIFSSAIVAWLVSDDFEIFSLTIKTLSLLT